MDNKDLNVIKKMHSEGCTTKEIAETLNVSTRTVNRAFKDMGYVYDAKRKAYICDDMNDCKNELIPVNNEDEKIEIEYVSRTYSLPSDLERALKLKSVFENVDAKDIVSEALKSYIEKKYFNINL